MAYCVVWDIETRDKIQDQVGRFREDKVKALTVSCLCALKLDSEMILTDPTRALATAEAFCYWKHQPDAMERFLKLLDGAEAVGGFNLFGFDYLVMHKEYYTKGGGGTRRYRDHTFRTQDPFSRLRDATGVWFKLDTLLKENSLEPKVADGLQAIEFWKEDRLEELETYCMKDVELCAEMMLLPTLKLPGGTHAPGHAFSLQGMIRQLRCNHDSAPSPKRQRS